jgi:hypothetical protein
MLNIYKPRKVIEVGSGYTSALLLDSIEKIGLDTRCAFVDPYPDLARKVTAPLPEFASIIPSRIQDVDLKVFDQLEENDILFIDSSHVVKTGSDVYHEGTEILPRLNRGVIVHFHDMFFPFEYPKNWVSVRNHSWNELYFLQTFLMYNSEYSSEFFNTYFAREQRAQVVEKLGPLSARWLENPGGGLWLRKQ